MVHQVPGKPSLLLNLKQDKGKLEKHAKELSIHLLEDWKELQEDDVQVDEISGGITNLLWKLSPDKKHKLAPVVFRAFGEQTDRLIEREREHEIVLQLNKAGFGAQVLASFDNGRIEAYLDLRTLEPKDMTVNPMSARIARRLQQFHQASVDGDRRPQTFAIIKKWIKMAKDLDFSKDPKKHAAYGKLDLEGMHRECCETEAACLRLDSPVVFTHCDMLSGNVLVPRHEDADAASTSPEGMQFIDFEYARWGYRGFDLGNHFNEYAGFECDYSRYPSKDHIAGFMHNYLEEGSGQKPSEAEVDAGVVECNAYALASHQFWGIWALHQASFSPIDFDYIGYVDLRWNEYHRRKQEFLSDVDAWCKRHRES